MLTLTSNSDAFGGSVALMWEWCHRATQYRVARNIEVKKDRKTLEPNHTYYQLEEKQGLNTHQLVVSGILLLAPVPSV